MVLRLPQLPLLLTALAAAAVLAGCSDITLPPDDDALLRTDRLVYDLRQDDRGNLSVDIPYTYHNRTGRTVYLANCLGSVPPSLEKWEAGEWRMAWSPVELLCLSPPVVIQRGSRYEGTLRVFAGAPGSNTWPRFEVPEPAGIYRLIWNRAFHNYDPDGAPAGTPLPLRDRVSNGFELRGP